MSVAHLEASARAPAGDLALVKRARTPAKGFAVALALWTTGCGYGMYVRPGLAGAPPVADRQIALSLLLVGDIGSDIILRADGWPLLDRLTQDLLTETPSVVAFLGDNVYPAGVPAADETERAREANTAARILETTLAAVSGAEEVIFVPGNHDWNDGRPGGHARILAQAALIGRLASQSQGVAARLLPLDGCPGPFSLDFASIVRLIVIDTEWLLMPDDSRRKPVGHETGCTYGPATAPSAFPGDQLTDETFYEALEIEMQNAGTRAVVLLSHEPLRSLGPHGGYMAGSWLPYVWPAIRKLIPRRQDFASSANRRMRERLDEILRSADANLVIAAAGHEHTLQVFDDPAGVYYLVSGSGSKKSPAGRDSNTLFKHGAHGYMRLDFLNDGAVHLMVREPAAQRVPLAVRLRPRG